MKLAELSEELQQKAHERWVNFGDYPWDSENHESLECFTNHFGLTVTDGIYGGACAPFVALQEDDFLYDYTDWGPYSDDTQTEPTGVRLATWLRSRLDSECLRAKVYKLPSGKTRKSRIQGELDFCPTGYFMDYALWDTLYGFIQSPSNQTFHEVMTDCVNEWAKACDNDYNDYFSFESFAEHCEANDYDFDEDGKL